MKPKPQVNKANLFHIGSTCPFCQETISEGQNILTCPDCSSIHHELCWDHNKGCASYSCDQEVTREKNSMVADITINSSELDKVIVPPKPVRRSSKALAEDYLPKKPERLSKLAVVSVVVTVLALPGIAGFITRPMIILPLALSVSIAAIIIGVIALVCVNMNQKLSGALPAGLAVLLSCIMIPVFILGMYRGSQINYFKGAANINFNEIPNDQQLSALPAGKANALRANIVVKCWQDNNLLGSLCYGSGVITKVKDKRAYIITNKHVIGMLGKDNSTSGEDAKIRVIMYNHEESDAKIEWMAPSGVDIAIISCEAISMKNYTPVKLKKTFLPPSSRVFAVGNPMNLFWSYTEGIVSSVRKQTFADNTCVDVYQTQTPINQGNSGGGLYSMDGSLVGINTWVHNKSVSEGLNFAISTFSILEFLGNDAEKYLTIQKTDKNSTTNSGDPK